jgi:nucleoside-diphosphate-sugar epimerase
MTASGDQVKMMEHSSHILITGGAGYIGSLLAGTLLYGGHRVTVVDDLLFGGDSLMGYLTHPHFRFVKANVCEEKTLHPLFEGVDYVVHLAAIVGFPACQQVGPQVAWRYNLEGTRNVFHVAEAHGVRRMVLSSTYSNYGIAEDGKPVTEESPLNPQSLYAETKIAAEQFLLGAGKTSRCAPVLFRFATLFGLSPRTRFDLIINQFVLEAIQKRKLIIYQKNYNRSFVHIRDIIRAIMLVLDVEEAKVRNQIFNVGSDNGNYSKEDLIRLVQKFVSGVEIEYKDLSFGGDMRDIRVSFEKIGRVLGYETKHTVEDGIRELAEAIQSGLVHDPGGERHRNAHFIVQ